MSGSSGYSLGGLAGSALTTSTFTNSYWDNQTSGQPDVGVGADDENMNGVIDGTETATMGVTGQTTTALRTPIGYTGIFVDWSVTIPGVAARTGGPWDFGGATDYPVLRGLGALPSFPAGTARLSIAEERSTGTTIGSPLTATDPDSNTLTYKLVGAGGSHFGIDGMTGQLMTKTNLDYEKPVDGDRDNTYEFMVQASDGMTVAFRSVSVSVSNAIDNLSPPAISGSATVAVAENSTAVARYSATDPDRATSTFAWSLAGNDAGAFNISASGVLTFATPPDYEAPGDIGTDNGDNIYEVTVQADDGGMTGELDVLVTVQAVDEPPVIDGDVRVTLREGASHHVGTYSTTDPEGAVVSWETLAGPDARYFALDIGGGLSFVDTPDYEARANKVYTVIVRAADASVPPKIGELTVTVTITNVNEGPTVEGPETIDVNEGHAGTLGTYRRVDPEGSLTNWGTISSPTALSGPDADRFRFDKQTGRLTFAAPPDFEEGGGQYEVTVDANDGELEGMLDVTVNVVNVEESGTLTFDRRRPVAGQETTATVTDPDNVVGATTWTWHRSTSRSGGWAEITAANTSTYTPVTGDSGNYLRATVTYEDGDASGKTLQAVTEFATVAANATNTAPELPDTAVTIDLPENALPDRNVGSRVQATDVDNDPITYSLSGASEFVIDQKTGQIKVAPDAEFDFESGRTSYTVTVTADDGFSGGSDTVGVTITITDVQEPPVAADDGERLDEDPLNGIEIRVLDNDSDPDDVRSALTVSVVTRPVRGSAVVNTSPGDEATITYTPDGDYHGADSFTYRVRDTGGRTSNVATVALTVDPVNDAPEFPAATAARQVFERAQPGDPVGAPVTATDVDGDDLDYSLTGSSNFEMLGGTAQITVSDGAVLDATNQPTHMVTVIVTDEGGANASIDVTITVTTGPVRPPIITGGGGGGGGPSGPSPSEVDFEWNVTRDIDELDGGHDTPSGLWSDGTTLWILENGSGTDDAVYAYDLESGERVEEREFELDETNRAPRGVWSDRTVVWVSDSGQEKLFAHDLATGERLPERDIALAQRNRDARGIWSDDETMWVLDGRKDSLFAYDLASGESLAEYALDDANDDPRGLFFDGVTFWVSDHGAKRLFAYRLPVPDAEEVDGEDLELERVRDEEFPNTVLSRASNNSPRGLWSDGDVMYVADESDNKVYTYNMPDAIDARLASLTLSGVDIGEFDPGRPDYEAVVADGTTATTVEAAALQRRTSVAIDPPDADDGAGGHQVALKDLSQITVTVTSADGSRTKTYRVRLDEEEVAEPAPEEVAEPAPEEAAEPAPEEAAGAAASCLRGDIAVGFSLVVSAGGSFEDLVTCVEGRNVAALYVLDGGAFVSYILGAPAFVNQSFAGLFADGVPALTPLVARSDGPATADPVPDAVTRPLATCLQGEIVEGFNLVLYEGGSVGDLEACAEGAGLASLYVLDDGVWVSHILGAPAFVNVAFRDLYAAGVPVVTPLVGKRN